MYQFKPENTSKRRLLYGDFVFEHNESAYYAALSMMKKTGKAAIVPTRFSESISRIKTVNISCSARTMNTFVK